MKKLLRGLALTTGLLVACMAASAQAANFVPPAATALCYSSALAGWIPMAASASGTPATYTPESVGMYGINGASYYPVQCDASGNLILAGVSTVVDTSTPVAVSTTLAAQYHFNENATAATAVTYNLPTAAAGKQFCFSNAYNGTAANTGVLTIATSASGQFIIFTDGTLSATGGNVTSGGAAADAACAVGVDATHWMLYVQRGTWTKH